jgi:glycosyltransferase involved in cell wall biosynthesis
MAEALVERGHDVHVATYPRGDPAVPVSYRLHRAGSPRATLDTRPGPSLKKFFWFDPLLLKMVRRLLRQERFDVIHAHHYEGLIAALAARGSRRSLPIVYDAHTLLATELPHYRLYLPAKAIKAFGSALDRKLPRRAEHVIAVSQRMQQWFCTHARVSGEQLSLIPNGVECIHFGSAERVAPARATDARVVAFAGNLAEYQGIGYLLAAFARLQESEHEVRLLLITESDSVRWMQRIQALNIGAAVDFVQAEFADLPAHLQAADVLVNPRINCDGIPQKLLNYMAAGKPIVSFAGSAAVLQHERTGLIVADADVDALAAAIARMLRAPELGRELGRAAREHVIAAHSWEQVALRVEDVYTRVLGGAADQ